jgi:conjugative relaxase-like TrwC/TraI family protein
MISIGKVRDAEYYVTETHADDVHRYYAESERTGTWAGSFAEQLGLSGDVDTADFRAVLNGKNPATGERLTATPVRVHAFDMAISLDKGSSIIRALTDETTRDIFDKVLALAQADYIEFVETWAAKVRRGRGGLDQQDGSGIAAAVFHHHSSREGDPQEHLHVVVLNASAGPDDRITGLDTRLLYKTRYTGEAVFQASFRYHAAQQLGLTYDEVDRHGVAQIAGVPDHVKQEFSQRRNQIERAMAERGVTSAGGARIAALATRAPKAQPVPDAEMRRGWQARAKNHDFSLNQVPCSPRAAHLIVTHEELAYATTEKRAHFDQLEAIRQVAIAAADGATLRGIKSRVDAFLESPLVVSLGDGLWTTREMLELEERSIAIANNPSSKSPTASPEAITAATTTRPTLGADQTRLVEAIGASTSTVNVVVGKAGAGKTYALDALRDAYQQQGHRVIGAAVAARAAKELQSGAGINSTTIHSLLSSLESGRIKLDPSTVVVVDEAGMAPTRQLAPIIQAAYQSGAKVVLVGDPKQLPEIDAGGLFNTLTERTPTVELSQNRRQTNPLERIALDQLREGQVDNALDNLHRAGNLVVAPTANGARAALVSDWYDAHNSGRATAMVAANRSDVADLNQRARHQLITNGKLGDVVLTRGGNEYRVGDEVLTHRNRYDLGLTNGLRGTITHGNVWGLSIDLADGSRSAHIPRDYLDAGHVTHGYAFTIHKAQGMTVDTCFVLGDDSIYAEMGYTGLSRGRDANRLYLVASRDELNRLRKDPAADIRRSLGQSRAQKSAVQMIEPMGISR